MKRLNKKQLREFILQELLAIADDKKIDVGVRAQAFHRLALALGMVMWSFHQVLFVSVMRGVCPVVIEIA